MLLNFFPAFGEMMGSEILLKFTQAISTFPPPPVLLTTWCFQFSFVEPHNSPMYDVSVDICPLPLTSFSTKFFQPYYSLPPLEPNILGFTHAMRERGLNKIEIPKRCQSLNSCSLFSGLWGKQQSLKPHSRTILEGPVVHVVACMV